MSPTRTRPPRTHLSAGWSSITLTSPDHPWATLAEPTALPGVVIAPAVAISRPRWSNRWQLIHVRSSGPFGIRGPLAYMREAATYLAQAGGIDFEQLATTLHDLPVFHEHVRTLRNEIEVARGLGRPLWWTRPSWVQRAPRWRAVPPSDSHQDGDFEFDTWREVVRFADSVLAEMPWSADPNSVLRRDTEPSWLLACAAPLCGQDEGDQVPPAVLEMENDSGCWPWLSQDRNELADLARDQHWRTVGRHWLCPACAADHPVHRV